jgi:hypothetical protein
MFIFNRGVRTGKIFKLKFIILGLLRLYTRDISLVGIKMFNVIKNRLRFIKHIQNNFFGSVDVTMTGDFY